MRDELARAALSEGWYDGEIVVFDAAGRPHFAQLYTRGERRSISYIDSSPLENTCVASISRRPRGQPHAGRLPAAA